MDHVSFQTKKAAKSIRLAVTPTQRDTHTRQTYNIPPICVSHHVTGF